jgi:membrane protease subunit HflC
MRPKTTLIAIIVAALVLVAANAFYIVPEGKQAIIVQFGEPMGTPKTNAGLYVKIPFIQQARYFEKRILEWVGTPNEIPTRDKKFIWVDTVARWKITDALRFMQSVTTEAYARSRLDDIIDNAVRDTISRYPLVEVVRNTNDIFKEKGIYDDDRQGEDDISIDQDLTRIKVGREKILKMIFKQAAAATGTLGIELVDVRIRRINYIDSVRQKVFSRMISERERAAAKLRSEGQGARAEIEGQKEKDLKKIRSEAYRKAQEIKGKADAEAARIYAESYGQDPEFYSLWNTLASYKDTLPGSSTVLLSTDNEYFEYIKSQKKGLQGHSKSS